MQRDSAFAQDDVEPLLSGYRPLPGIFDEMVARDGRVRPHWQPLLAMLAGLGPQEVGRRFAAADRHLRDSGVFYRVYEDSDEAERPWPLSHLPLLIDASEWQALKAGLIQRAELLEAVLADAYGPAKLMRESRLPAVVVAGNPEFLRPLVGVAPPGGAHLRFYAVDVGRSPDGHWWVLGDRTQAPSGAGYALENRLALSRAMPDVYRELRVERLAPFFQAFQAELSALNRQDDSRVCVLTPGPMNETYFEHAYLARYLGFLLVEGADLTVRDDGVFIRTVSGLKRAEVLLRRLDADFADPLELNARSRLGVPGLVQAVRDGTVVIANALGSGVVEARALLSFLPALAPAVLGSRLALPNVATWWLGQARARDEIIDRLDQMVIASAFVGELPGYGERREVLGAALEPAERARILQQIAYRGIDFVAKEAVTLSTTPVWRNGRLEPRPFTLRLFLARTGDGWRVMPGGFVRVADDIDARAVSLQRGGSTGDAWVLSDQPVAETTLLPAPDRITITRATGRAAEPGRRQPVLGRALRRTCRGDAAAGAGADQPGQRQRRSRHPRSGANLLAARRLGGGADRPAECQAGAGRRRRIAAPRPRRRASPSRRRRPVRRLGDPRPVFTRCLARADRPVRADLCADRSSAGGERDLRANGWCVAHHRVVFGIGAGKHEPARRLALP